MEQRKDGDNQQVTQIDIWRDFPPWTLKASVNLMYTDVATSEDMLLSYKISEQVP